MYKIIFILPVILLSCSLLFSQDEGYYSDKNNSLVKAVTRDEAAGVINPIRGTLLHAVVENKDTIPVVNLPGVCIESDRYFKNKEEEYAYTVLKRNVKKVYPYAKLAGKLLKQYNDTLSFMTTERQKKKYLKNVEQQLKKEFSGELEKMSWSQGRILIKLIDRETGNTSYELVKEMRGAFSAFFWQTIARIFDHNLKSHYNPIGDDYLIEDIVLSIESTEQHITSAK